MMSNYGDFIRVAREAHGWTQAELATHSGVPKRTIQEIEAGRVQKPQRSTDIKLRRTLDLQGDPDAERTDWPEDVTEIVDLVGAYLVAVSPAERIRWFRDFLHATDTNG